MADNIHINEVKKSDKNKIVCTVLPESTVKLIEEALQRTGAVNVSDFVRDAVRRYLKDLGYLR